MSFSLKEFFLNKQTISLIGQQITKSYPPFDQKKFIKQVFDEEWDGKELKQRMTHVSESINTVLNKPYVEALGILLDVNENLSNNFTNMIFPEFVSLYGLDHFDDSMFALKEFTRNSSSEFAVRSFIQKYGADAMQYMYRWSKDENYHVRRLASEGCRPLLPWGQKLHQFVKDPTPILPILDQLKEDPELYVQKSVANNLNDISKNHPDLVLHICTDWNKIDNNGTKFIVKRACRTLLKKGNQEALELFGVGDIESVKVTNLKIKEKNIKIGTSFSFSFDIEDTNPSSTNQDANTSSVNSKKLVVSKLKNKKQSQSEEEDEDSDESFKMQDVKKGNKKNNQKSDESSDEDDIKSDASNTLRIEYQIDYLKNNGTHSSKVFMFKNQYNLPNKKITLEGSQKVQQLTTRKHYPGIHYLSIIVNGTEKSKTSFKLLKED